MNQNIPPQGGQTVVITNPNSQIITSNPQQYGGNIIVQQAPPITQGKRYAHFYNRFCAGLGITQIVIGVLAILMNIVIYIDRYHTSLFFMSHGTWGGIFFIITGSLGTAAGSTKNTCLIVAFMVMSIIAVSFPAPNMLIISAIDVSIVVSEYYNVYDNCNYDYYCNDYNYYYYGNENRVGVAMESIILILSVIELVVGIISAAVCCHAVCCCKSTGAVWSNRSMGYIYNQNQHQVNMQYPTGQYMAQPSAVTSYQPVPMYQQQPQGMIQQQGMYLQQPQAMAQQLDMSQQQPQAMAPQAPVYQEKQLPQALAPQPPVYQGEQQQPQSLAPQPPAYQQ